MFFLFFIAFCVCQPELPDYHDCYDDGNTTIPAFTCSKAFNCECALCRRAYSNSDVTFCIANTANLNVSAWNCSLPFDPNAIEECEKRNRNFVFTMMILFYILAGTLSLICLALFVSKLFEIAKECCAGKRVKTWADYDSL